MRTGKLAGQQLMVRARLDWSGLERLCFREVAAPNPKVTHGGARDGQAVAGDARGD